VHDLQLSSLLDELTKIAKKKAEKSNKKAPGFGEFAGAAGAHVGLSAAGNGLAAAAGKSMMHGERGANTTLEEVERLKKHMAPDVPVFHRTQDSVGPKNSFYVPKGGSMHQTFGERMGRKFKDQEHALYESHGGYPKSVSAKAMNSPTGGVLSTKDFGPHVVAHELGHAKFHKTRAGKVLFKTRLPGMAVGRLGAPAMALQDPDSKASKWSPAVGALAAAPTLIDEAAASIHGYRGMKGAGFTAKQLSHGRNQLLKAYGTYTGKLAVPAVGLPLAIRAIRKSVKKRRLAREARAR
jgi:hypothetical protein